MTPVTFNEKQVDDYLQRMQSRKILVLGDIMLDRFIWGQVSRISPEAPVPVVRVTRESAYPGGAANVARNLADFGLPVSVAGTVGTDPAGDNLFTGGFLGLDNVGVFDRSQPMPGGASSWNSTA